MKLPTGISGLVYSTEGGRMCPTCRQPVTQCDCKTASAPAKTDGVVRVSRESKGRGGKNVTLVKGVPLTGDALTALGKQLKTMCGSGGTVKDGVIEIQGDHCDRVVEWLKAQGFTVKRSGSRQ
jgi:translation initiation factor 1